MLLPLCDLPRSMQITSRSSGRVLPVRLWTVCLVALVMGPVLAAGADWPRFRGPNGSGVATDAKVPVEFAPQDAQWKTAIPGTGHSSPVACNGKIYLTTAIDKGAQRLLLCLDLKTGKKIWEAQSPGGVGHTHQKNSLASGTPFATADRVFVPSWNGDKVHLTAYTTEGKEIWDRDLGGFTSQHGPGHSPVLLGKTVIFVNEQDGSAAILGLDAETGKTVWETPRQAARTCYSTPFSHERANGTVEVVVASTTGIGGYDPATGNENWLWKWTGNSLRTVGSPIESQGMVLVSSGNGGNDRHAVAVRLDGQGKVPESFLVWENRKGFPYVPSMVASGDYLFFVNDKGFAGCHSLKTGEQIWSERLGGTFTASLILVNDKVYAINEAGKVYVFAAAPAYQLLATNDLGESVYATPAVADGHLLIRTWEHLYSFGK